ncbi:hypothetical protein QR685DRAFT_449231, partial [Neurospora intermedia]
ALYYSTPKKNRFISAFNERERKDKVYFKLNLFKEYGISYITGWRIFKNKDQNNGRTFYSTYPKRRGRRKKLSSKNITIIEKFFKNKGFNIRTIL